MGEADAQGVGDEAEGELNGDGEAEGADHKPDDPEEVVLAGESEG